MKKIKLYVGCALNNAPKEFVAQAIELRAELSKNPSYEILEFLGPGEPQDIYERDIYQCVMNADAMLAICDLPSLGLGYEMAVISAQLKRPLFAVAHRDSNVSKLVIGIHKGGPFAFRRYESLSQVPDMLESWIKETFD